MKKRRKIQVTLILLLVIVTTARLGCVIAHFSSSRDCSVITDNDRLGAEQ